jgi:LPS export ABC transporter protein LptC
VTDTRSGLLVLGAAAAAATSAWLLLQGDSERAAAPTAQPELYIRQPRWDQFDAQGRLLRQLRARRAEQWPDERYARLFEPHLDIHDRRQRQWQLSALRGRLPGNGDPLLLRDQVVLHSGDAGKGPVLRTDSLNVARDGTLVETDAAVVLQSGNWHFSADGLRAELGRERIELFNRVRGTHD